MPPVTPRKKSVAQRLAESGNDMSKAHIGVLLDLEGENKKQNEALQSILSGQKTQNDILSEIKDKKAPEVNFEPLVTSIDDVYIKAEEIRTAIENLPKTDLSNVETLLNKIVSIKPEKVDLSQLSVVSSLLDEVLTSVLGLQTSYNERTEDESLQTLVTLVNTLNENVLSIPELDYEKLAEVIKKSVKISVSASGGGSGFVKDVAGDKINPATKENQTNGTQVANPSLGQGKTLQYGVITQGGAGTTSLVGAQGASLKIKVVSYVFTIDTAGTVKFTGSGDLTGAMTLVEKGGAVAISQPSSPLFETGANQALSIVSTGGAVQGHFSYFVE